MALLLIIIGELEILRKYFVRVPEELKMERRAQAIQITTLLKIS